MPKFRIEIVEDGFRIWARALEEQGNWQTWTVMGSGTTERKAILDLASKLSESFSQFKLFRYTDDKVVIQEVWVRL